MIYSFGGSLISESLSKIHNDDIKKIRVFKIQTHPKIIEVGLC